MGADDSPGLADTVPLCGPDPVRYLFAVLQRRQPWAEALCRPASNGYLLRISGGSKYR